MMHLVATIIGSLFIAACSQVTPTPDPVFFELSEGDFTATVEMPAELPTRDFDVIFRSSTGDEIRSTYEYVPAGKLDCYWDRTLPMLCRGSGRPGEQFPDEVSDGRHVRAERLAGGLIRYQVYGSENGMADFADFRGERLETFGFVDQETGATFNLWRRRE